MKRLTILITLISLFLRCTAPEVTPTIRNAQSETAQLNRLIIIQDIVNAEIFKLRKEQTRLFIEKLKLIESSSNWKSVNKLGCIGLFQFTAATLAALGHSEITAEAFKDNPAIFPPSLQEDCLNELMRANEKGLKKCFLYIGKVVNGVLITKAGLLAGAHLGGVGGVTAFLENGVNRHDINNASVSDYIQLFSQFNI
jgi:hypothetical protein